MLVALYFFTLLSFDLGVPPNMSWCLAINVENHLTELEKKTFKFFLNNLNLKYKPVRNNNKSGNGD